MKKLTFAEKNDLIVKHKGAASFDRDLELFKKHCPAHSLLKDLARANSFSFARLDGQMLGLLLDNVSIDEILENRTKEPEQPIDPKTIEEIKELLTKELELDAKDLDALSEIMPLWITKSDEEILSAVKKLLGETATTEGTATDGAKEVANAENTGTTQVNGAEVLADKLELPNSQKTQAMIQNAKTIAEVKTILDADIARGKPRAKVQEVGKERIEVLTQTVNAGDNADKKKD